MKRVGNLFDAIIDRNNLQLAVWRAMQGKHRRPEARAYLQKFDKHLAELAEGLLSGTFPVGRFQQFLIRDPKERVITAPCFPERVLHHAIMNVCEPHFERWLIDDTFACRVGKGRNAALNRASQFAKLNGWFLSMDVRKYFDSISHEVLNAALARKIKDYRLLTLFEKIIGSYRGSLGCGLPIGSLTSQHFANFYLDRFDRFIKENLSVKGYVRYMDDIVLWGKSREELQIALDRSTQFIGDELRLTLKPTPFINRTAHGLDFLGSRLYPTHRVLNRRSRVRFQRRLGDLQKKLDDGEIGDLDYQTRCTALAAFAIGGGVASWRFRSRILSKVLVNGPMARTE